MTTVETLREELEEDTEESETTHLSEVDQEPMEYGDGSTDDIDVSELTVSDIEDRLPQRARVRDSGVLEVDPVSLIGSEIATLTERRARIIRLTREKPLKGERQLAREMNSSKSYVRYTQQDFSFLLRDDVLYEFFVEDLLEDDEAEEEVEEVEEEEEEETEEGLTMEDAEESRIVEAEADSCDFDHSSFATIELETVDEGYDLIQGLVEGGEEDLARELFERMT